MSEGEPKSAIEIAMEKLRARGESFDVLTDEQRAEIAEIRNRFKAKVAEVEIKTRDKMTQAASYEELETLQAELARQKERLNQEMEAAVQKVRGSTQ